MNKIVVIKGKENVGKTTTIRLAYRMLLELLESTPISYQVKYESHQYSRNFDEDFMDFTATVNISGHIVVFHSPGDTSWFVELLREPLSKPNMIIICATRTHGNHQTVRIYDALIKEYNYQSHPLEKNELSDADNKNLAQKLLYKIGSALKEKLDFSENSASINSKQTKLLYKLANSLYR
jgi:hypothetical protein